MLNKWIRYWRQGGQRPTGDAFEPAELDRLERIWRAADPPQSDLEVDAEAAWAKVEDRLFDEDVDRRPSSLTLTYRRNYFWAAAAALVGLAIGAWWLLAPGPVEDSPWLVFANAEETPLELSLPDGSQIWLNAASEIRYREDFRPRQLALRGEAFFTVTRDPQRPFSVQTGELETRVLGTSFNVRAYDNEPVEVAVSSGRVAVSAAAETVELAPGQTTTYRPATKQLEAKTTAVSEPDLWRESSISLGDGQYLPEIVEDLSNYYRRTFVLSSSELVDCRLAIGEEIVASRVGGHQEVLSDLNFFLEDRLRFTERADTVFISGVCAQ